ncbi:hypothetical protein DITRI_Ditri07aG0156500 [Diplodiscus trichospermus]
MVKKVFEQSKKFFLLSVEEKIKFAVKNQRGYTGLYHEKLDTSLNARGDSKEFFDVGPLAEDHLNQWPSEVMAAGMELVSLIALALNLDEDFFEKLGAFNEPMAFIGLLRYPGDVGSSREEIYGAAAHSDYGMITLLLTDGVPGLQVCREKFKQPQLWEDVPSISGAFIVNIGAMMERWTKSNCLFWSTQHRVMPSGQERYSVAFFLAPSKDCILECLESCCSESCPPRFPPIRSSDYLEERFRLAAMAAAESHRINI